MKTSKSPITVQLPHERKSSCSLFGSLTALAAGLALLGGQSIANAQSDNFDSGSLSAAWTKEQFFGQSYTFPSSGSGKALRIQANPIPGTAPAAAAILQTNVYTDFYMSLDVVNWVVENQAIVLLGRWTMAGLGGDSGIILNYDVAQDGDNSGDRKGGQLQINTVTAGFVTKTLAAADITFEPGHSYRLVLQAVGSIYKGQAYDLNDLTKPLVTFYGDDTQPPALVSFTSGLCGFLSFSRNGSVGTTDVTIDNYYAATTDPNAAIAPAIHHPLFTVDGSGVPQVTSRTPVKRFTNFHPPASGISFTAETYTAGQIDASATKLYLNGVDVSASLSPLPANGSTVNFTTAAATLTANTLYSARIEVQDTTGTLKSTNTFWFDTFSDAYLKSAGVKTIEAEDYNYSGGSFKLDPIAVSGLDSSAAPVNGGGVGYFDLIGTPDVDFFKPGGSFNAVLAEYRTLDRVQITQGSMVTVARDEAGDITDNTTNLPPIGGVLRINDTQRSQYVATNVLEYQVKLTSPGDWLNYTRNFTPTNYHVYLRCGSFGSTTVYLDQVTSDPTVAGQSTVRFGSFNVDNHLQRLNYKYEPLMFGSSPAVVSLAGLKTLRLTLGGTVTKDERLVVMDYLLLVPTSDSPTLITPVNPPTIFDNFNDLNDTNPLWNHYDPLAGLSISNSTYSFPGGSYRIFSPAPDVPDYGPARVGSFLAGANYTDFYVSADLIDFDDTVRQAFGVAARINTPGLGTTGGYLFSWEPGSGILPGTSNGDLDISRLVNESPTGQIETEPSGLHLTKGKSYRFVFMGSGTNFEGQVYELPDTSNPLIRLPANDPGNLYPSGQVGLVVASQGSPTIQADATFDNFLATTAEPRLTVAMSGGSVVLTWPFIPYRLQSSPSLSSPVWTEVTTGITLSSEKYLYSAPATASKYFRLVYP